MPTPRWFATLIAPALVTAVAAAQEPLRLIEKFPVGYQYHVSSRFSGGGTLPVPAKKDRGTGQSLDMTGKSVAEYDERILDADAGGEVHKTLRIFRQVDLHKTLGKDEFPLTIRPAVRRMVVLPEPNRRMPLPFSPDGPLTYAELDIVSKEVFTPSLAGLLPAGAVKPGDTWKVGAAAVIALTNLEKIDEGAIDCRFDEITTQLGRRVARVSLSGGVRGVDEFGPVRHVFDGYFYFDLQSNHLSYLTFKGQHLFLDEAGKVGGKIEGTFTLTRQVNVRPPDFSDEALRAVNVFQNDDNTLMLYDNPDLGIRFEYPRGWKVASNEGTTQILLDGPGGNGLMVTPLAPAEVPTAARYQTEAKADIEQRFNGKIFGMQSAKMLQGEPRPVERFAIEAEMRGQRQLLDYFIVKQKNGGATLAATLLPDAVRDLRPQVERIAKSVVVTR
ncbi:MAG: hypothetical protein ACJ8F7_13965 [Gemmataceae bacterium]